MTWGGSALGKLGWRSMPISRKVSLFLLGAGVTVAVMVSLGFWWEEQQRLQSILPQRVERIARLLQEGEEGARTAEGGQQLAPHAFHHTGPVRFGGGVDDPPKSPGSLKVHVSSVAAEAEARAITRTALLWFWAGFLVAWVVGVACLRRLLRKPLIQIEKLIQESTAEGLVKLPTGDAGDELHRIQEAFKQIGETTKHLRLQLSTRDEQLSKLQDQANWLTEAALSGNRIKVEFLATMSHEIRTPLNGIVGFTSLLLETAQNREQKEFTSIIQESARTLLKLIDTLLDLSKIQAGKMKLESAPYAIAACVNDAVASMTGAAREKGLSIQVRIDPMLPAVTEGDAYRVRQVILNLLGNAVKFTQTGSIRVEAERRDSSAGGREAGTTGQLLIRVTDTGEGIPPEKRTTLFRKFQQLDGAMSRQHGGSGLGLVMSKSFVELMGGELGMTSEVGHGSTFWFAIPLKDCGLPKSQRISTTPLPASPPAAEPELSKGPAHSESSNRSGLRALVADDNRLNRRLAEKLLEKLGFQIDHARDGREAVERVKSTNYDLVLMDWQMPGMDGTEATREIRRWEETCTRDEPRPARKRLPIVAVTANAMPGDLETCLLSGMDGYIAKPLQEADLRKAIQHHLSP
jgi:signal transduction histidine kinase/CheY-like chemotaxis protein